MLGGASTEVRPSLGVGMRRFVTVRLMPRFGHSTRAAEGQLRVETRRTGREMVTGGNGSGSVDKIGPRCLRHIDDGAGKNDCRPSALKMARNCQHGNSEFPAGRFTGCEDVRRLRLVLFAMNGRVSLPTCPAPRRGFFLAIGWRVPERKRDGDVPGCNAVEAVSLPAPVTHG